MPDDVLSPQDIAPSYRGAHVETVRRHIRAGLFPFVPVEDGGVMLPSTNRCLRISGPRWRAYVAGNLTENAA